ncbi:MAG: VOC family protein [Acidimicrobiales bacterium]|nr:VOC family protein [Acidimicrobiales bacterium]
MSSHRPYVQGLVPFVRVRDVMRSTAFYELFGFEVLESFEPGGHRVWCWLEQHQARLMLEEAGGPVVAAEQAVQFYVYADDLEELHELFREAGFEPGPIGPGAPGPNREFRVDDPDGYRVMVTDAFEMSLHPLAEP